MGLEMQAARAIALTFALKESEKAVFKAGWNWRERVDDFTLTHHDQLQRETSRQFDLFASAIRGNSSKELGHRFVHHAPTHESSYVVFSDHHWADASNRQSFFTACGNRELYVEVIRRYFEAGFTLIENGDVEELIIFEPTKGEFESRMGMSDQQLRARRLECRYRQLERILNDRMNKPLYAILRDFYVAGRYFKVAGNHDYDLQEEVLLEALRRVFPKMAAPYDLVLLETDGRVDYAIMHGHQFDTSTNPKYASAVGETISESMSWAFQGPDRTWRWRDQTNRWANGELPFNNLLVSDDYKWQHEGILGGLLKLARTAAAGAGALIRNLHDEDAWELLFKHNIAWEYFEHNDPQAAIDKEVKTGDDFFKFRHMDEFFIKKKLEQCFDETHRPRLVLGHSHEVRFEPAYLSDNIRKPGMWTFPWYYNTGAAGRFENLIWGLEIVAGTPQLVGWSRTKPRNGRIQRHVFSPNVDEAIGVLTASRGHTPIPEPKRRSAIGARSRPATFPRAPGGKQA